MDKSARIRELVKILNEASKAYYQEAREIVTNYEYDKLYDELVLLENETGIVLAGSPTVNVGYEVLSDLPKEAHPGRMLSLDKTKDREALKAWLSDKDGILSWKLDGLTIVLTYENGELAKAVTRGNGEIGEVVTANAKVFDNVPLAIPYKGSLTLRGEAVIKYSDFEKINAEIDDADSKYKNPRNLCSGSVRQLNTRITAERHVNFMAFSLVSAEGVDFGNSRKNQMEWLRSQGFDVVEYLEVCAEPSLLNIGKTDILSAIEWFAENVSKSDYPSDGLVLSYDDIAYGQSLGNTSKFPRDSIAFKWQDEIADTILREIEWSASRTGLINPVAIFDPVDIEGTTVSRASVHNISIVKELKLGIGDIISVYKANMIIPQIAENKTGSGTVTVPDTCPVCGSHTIIKNENGVETLFCPNEDCPAKQIKSFSLFVSRDALNIDGLSEATIEKFVSEGIISDFADLFHIERHRDVIVNMEGFGQKSFDNLASSINKARETTMSRFIYSLGIPGIGVANAKLISRACGDDWETVKNISFEELTRIDGIGSVMAEGYRAFFDNEKKREVADAVFTELVIEKKEAPSDANSDISGKTFVITGSLEHFGNRNELKEIIENAGGKVSGSVSKKTDYLINNDITSNSSKNKTAKELGVPIITEEQFLKEILKEGE